MQIEGFAIANCSWAWRGHLCGLASTNEEERGGDELNAPAHDEQGEGVAVLEAALRLELVCKITMKVRASATNLRQRITEQLTSIDGHRDEAADAYIGQQIHV